MLHGLKEMYNFVGETFQIAHIMSNVSQYNYVVEPFSEDYCGSLAWGTLGNLILRCASMHAGEHGFGYPQMIAIHHAWVLSRLVIEMDERPCTDEPFGIQTWVDRLYRQFTDRHFSIVRPDGTAYGHATSIWALIDTETRQPADLTQLPDGGFTDALMPDRPSPIAPMGRIRMKHPQLELTRKALYTDLDINGHVNSIRYVEFLLNHFSPEEMKLHPVRRIEMAYCLEAYCGDVLQVWHEVDERDPKRHLFEIRKETDGSVIVKAALVQR